MSHKRTNAGPAVIEPALLDDEQSAQLLGVGVRRFHALRSETDWLPTPRVLAPRILRWSRDELLAAIRSIPQQDAKEEPLQLLKARVERAKRTGELS